MNWADILVPLGTAIVGTLGGILVAPHLKGKPPAPRRTWDEIDREQDEKRKREAK